MLNTKSKSKDLVAEKVTFENKSNFYGAQVIEVLFETILDLSPINYKTRSKMPIFRNSTIFLDPTLRVTIIQLFILKIHC